MSRFNDFMRYQQVAFRGANSAEAAERYALWVNSYFPKEADLIVDLGCGDGTFLKTLNRDISKIGIDEQDYPQSEGFSYQRGSVFNALRKFPTGKVGVITAFHLFEHLTGEEAFELLEEISRVLMRKGCFVMEVPNFAHPLVWQQSYWLDPTHKNPPQPQLMEEMCRFNGLIQRQLIYSDYIWSSVVNPRWHFLSRIAIKLKICPKVPMNWGGVYIKE